MMDITQTFYDAMASAYDKLFFDWNATTHEQAAILDRIFRDCGFSKSASVLDCACGIGTQSIGLAALGYRVTASDISRAELAEKAGRVTGKITFDAAQAGDKTAQEVLDNYFKYVAEGITNMVNVFQPEKVVIGGSVSKQGDYLLNPIKEIVNKDDYNRYMHKAEVEIATLFGDAGIIGAALSAKK